MLLLRNFAKCANNFAQIWVLRKLSKQFCVILIFAQIAQTVLRKYAHILFLLRVMRNNAEYCAKVVSLHAQMIRKSLQKKIA